MPGCRLTLLLPGLFGPAADPDARGNRAEQDRQAEVLTAGLELPHLTRLLSRGRPLLSELTGPNPEDLFFKAFGLAVAANDDLPAAPLSAALDGLDAGEGVWLRADPVHLRPDPGRLILRDNRDLNLTLDQARQLAAELNPEIRELDLELIVAAPDRWYLRLDSQPRIRSCSPATAHGQDTDSCLVRGDDAGSWHRIQNHIQMLLYQSSVNSAREARGQAAINSLWFWGAGAMPHRPDRRWTQVCGDDPLVEALAHYSDSAYRELPAAAADWLDTATGDCPTGDFLMVSREPARAVQVRDREAWQESLAVLEHQWFAVLSQKLADRKLENITVDGGGGRAFVLSARDVRKWWRRDKALRILFSTARAPLA